MKNSCLLLLKVQLYNQFKINDLKGKNKRKEKAKVIAMAVVFAFLGAVLILYSFGLGYGLEKIGAGEVIPGYALAITSIITLFFTMIKTNGVIFGYRDYDMLMSLPVKTSTVIASRFLSMYVMNTLCTSLIMIPMGVAYCIFEKPAMPFYALWSLGILTASLIPTTIATVLGALIIAVSSRFRHTTAITTILSFALIFGFMGLSMSMGSRSTDQVDITQLAQLGNALSAQINKIYPVAWLFTQGVVYHKLLYYVWYLGISLGWYYLFIKLVSLRYKQMNTGLTTYHTNSNYKLTELKAGSPLAALYRKELKRFFSSSLYVLNVGIGEVMMLAAVIICFTMGPEKLEEIMEIPGMAMIFVKILPFVMTAMMAMTCTTCTSLSLEGKNLWILKSSPIPVKTIFQSKILVNLTLLLPAAIFGSTLMAIRFRMDVISTLLVFLIPLVYSFFTAIWGMFINIKFPNYEWESETAVIKQGMSSMIGMLGGLVFAMVPIALVFVLHQIDYRVIQAGWGILIGGLTVVLYGYETKVKI